MIKDTLINCCEDCTSSNFLKDEPHPLSYGRGIFVGVVATLMFINNWDIDVAIHYVYLAIGDQVTMQGKFDTDCIPKNWLKYWK